MLPLATVEVRNPKVPPALTPGKVTPEILYRWERSCKEHFRAENVAEEEKVKSVLFRLQDLRIGCWVDDNETTLKALDFATFMNKLREEVLRKGWDREIKLAIQRSRQGERPFYQWAYEMRARNALLRGRPCHFSDEALREVLEINMDEDLELRMRRVAAGEVSLWEWIEAVKEEEFVTRRREAAAMAMAREIYGREQRGVKSSGSGRAMGKRVQ